MFSHSIFDELTTKIIVILLTVVTMAIEMLSVWASSLSHKFQSCFVEILCWTLSIVWSIFNIHNILGVGSTTIFMQMVVH